MAGTIRNVKFESALARRKRRVFITWIAVSVISAVALLGGTAYWLVWSDSFAITDPIIGGVDGETSVAVSQMLDRMMDSRLLGVVPSGRSEILFPDDALVAQVLAELPDVRSVTVEKDYPHTLHVRVVPRTSLGVWCHRDDCAHFDETGATFGSALPSTGSLLMTVHDERIRDGGILDRAYLGSVLALSQLLREVGIAVRDYTIPADGVLELRVRTMAGYTVKLAVDVSVEEQVSALDAFLVQKHREDALFAPDYIDVRIPGRVYYQ